MSKALQLYPTIVQVLGIVRAMALYRLLLDKPYFVLLWFSAVNSHAKKKYAKVYSVKIINARV